SSVLRRARKKATRGGADRLCTGAKGRNTEGGGKATGGGRRPKGACPVRRSCVRGDGHKNSMSEPGRPRPDAAFGSPVPTFAGGAKAARLPRAVRPEDTLPISSKPNANRLS